jgi:hypothetical protein
MDNIIVVKHAHSPAAPCMLMVINLQCARVQAGKHVQLCIRKNKLSGVFYSIKSSPLQDNLANMVHLITGRPFGAAVFREIHPAGALQRAGSGTF